ncbi:DUF397 domain-containing protein [Actinocorallia lasiicapitis]
MNLEWRKSSYSGTEDDPVCVEVARFMPKWRKSSHSGTADDQVCVELSAAPFGVAVRDSKNPEDGYLRLSAGQFARLARGVKR